LRVLIQEKVKREEKWKLRWVEGVVPLVVVREEDDEGGRGMKRERFYRRKMKITKDANKAFAVILAFPSQ
jgi:hypothetical protein